MQFNRRTKSTEVKKTATTTATAVRQQPQHKIYTSGSNYNNTVLYVQHLFDRFSCCCRRRLVRAREYIGWNLPKWTSSRRSHDCQTLTYTFVLLPASVRSDKIDCREHGCRSKWKWNRTHAKRIKRKCTARITKRNETTRPSDEADVDDDGEDEDDDMVDRNINRLHLLHRQNVRMSMKLGERATHGTERRSDGDRRAKRYTQ